MARPVETYSGYRADERPIRFLYEGRTVEVKRILRQWRDPNAECFRVQGDDARTYELRQEKETNWDVTCCSRED